MSATFSWRPTPTEPEPAVDSVSTEMFYLLVKNLTRGVFVDYDRRQTLTLTAKDIEFLVGLSVGLGQGPLYEEAQELITAIHNYGSIDILQD